MNQTITLEQYKRLGDNAPNTLLGGWFDPHPPKDPHGNLRWNAARLLGIRISLLTPQEDPTH